MPLYEYRCRLCGERLEALQRVGEGAAGLHCPRCGAGGLEREVSTFASAGSGPASACGGSGRFT